MTDLDADLRTMMRARATDITAVPADMFDLPIAGTHAATPEVRRHRGHGWLIAASIVLVAAVAAAVLGIRRGTADDQAARSGDASPTVASSSPRTSRPATTAPAIATTSASLLRFDANVQVPSGYTLHTRIAVAGSQTFTFGKNGEHLSPADRAMHAASAYVTVYEAGRFDVTSLAGRSRATVNGHPGYYGVARGPQLVSATAKLTTLAWRYASDAWATVQARTAATRPRAQLQRLADATRAGETAPFAMPLQLRSVPAGYRVTDGYIDRTGQFDRMVDISNAPATGDSTTLTIMIDSARTDRSANESGGTVIHVDGRTGRLWNNGTNASFRVGSRVVGFNLGGPAFTTSLLQQFLAGVTWSADPADASTWFDGTSLLR